jgi:flagellar hook-associated protein 2
MRWPPSTGSASNRRATHSRAVDPDNTSIATKLKAFADAYNSLNSLMTTQLKYDDATKTAGPLQGDRTAVALQAQFRTLLTGTSGASSTFTRLSDIGMEVQKDGSLLINSTKQTAALANLAEVRKMFSNVDASDPAIPGNDGFAQRLRSLGDAVLGVEGAINMRSTGLQNQINRNGKREDELNQRATRTEARIKAQYSALDTKLATLNGLATFMTNQLTALAK